MDISLKLGMFFFLYYLISGVAMLINSKFILRAIDKLFHDEGQILMVGFTALIFGLFIISFHGYYEPHWPLLITIFGWLAVIKGAFYLMAHEQVKKFSRNLNSEKAMRIYGVVMLLLSAFFAYNIFMVVN